MKKLFFSALFALVGMLFLAVPLHVHGQIVCNCTSTATGDTINVSAGQTVCVTSNMTAYVNHTGGILCIAAGDTLTLNKIKWTNGSIHNNGVMVLDTSSFNIVFRNQTMLNRGTIILRSPNTIRITTGGENLGLVLFEADTTRLEALDLYNRGVINVSGRYEQNASSVMNNYYQGRINVKNGFFLGQRCKFYSHGVLTVDSGETNISGFNANLTNYGRTYVKGSSVTVSSGLLQNEGLFQADGTVTVSGTGGITNNCRLLIRDSFIVRGSFDNSGLLWITGPSGLLSIRTDWAKFGAKSKVRGTHFSVVSSNSVNGRGQFYFTGITRQEGTFTGATSSSSPESFITFYDTSLTSPAIVGSFFDFGIQGARVRRVPIASADTMSFYDFCAQQAFTLSDALPIRLYGFTAEAGYGDKHVLLNWQAAEEGGITAYMIERSGNGTDWKNIGSLAPVKTAGNNSYRFIDNEPHTGMNLYRIRAVDRDGSASYSATRAVHIGGVASDRVTIYPNPASDRLNLVSYGTAGSSMLTCELYDVNGRLVLRQEWQTAGNNIHSLNLSSLLKGIYLLKLSDANNGSVVLLQKVVRQ